tara:strand:+ start:35491 stop:35871 length:381 start_codon:yes stop_codon:yes gene_type:complete
LIKEHKVVDEAKSYFGLRTITAHNNEILLNGKPIFQVGPLDQNYWPGGGLTPPSEEAMLWEANYLKSVGCNMVRLHIKKNPDRYYFNCDKLGRAIGMARFHFGPEKEQISQKRGFSKMAFRAAGYD